MKKYIKPTTNYVELRAEESFAGVASGYASSNIYILKENNLKPEIFSENWVNFWLGFLRK